MTDTVSILAMAFQDYHRDGGVYTGQSLFEFMAKRLAAASPQGEGSSGDEAVVDRMVQRFLSWRLPEGFNPDNGISFKPTFNDHMDPPMRCNPTGTNLFDALQAKAMIRYILGDD